MRWVRFRQEDSECWGHVADGAITVHSGSPFEACRHETQERLPLEGTELLAPCVPSKIVCVGRNYAEHAKELGHAPSAEPLLFFKPPSALIGAGQPIRLPAWAGRIDYEGELAVVIGRRCARLRPEEPIAPYILGYTCLNDVTARDLQKKDSQWARAKGFDSFCPLGPWIETAPQPGPRPWHGLRIETAVNGEIRQRGTTADFIFSLETVFAAITAAMTLEPGDVIATGTPSGVGPLVLGDTIAIRIEGIGTLENPVAAGGPGA